MKTGRSSLVGRNRTAVGAVALGAVLAGFSGWFIKSMEINAISMTWIRMAVPAVVMYAIIRQRAEPIWAGRIRLMLGNSLLCLLRMVLFFLAFEYTTVANVIVVFYTFPIFTALLAMIFLKERVTRHQAVMLIVAFLGILLCLASEEMNLANRDLIGMLIALCSSLVYASTVVLFKSESRRYSAAGMVFYQNLAGALLLWPFFEWKSASMTDYGLGISYAILIGVLVFSLFFFGLKRLKAAVASALMYIEVVSAALVGYLLLGEPISLLVMGGAVLILSASYGLTAMARPTT